MHRSQFSDPVDSFFELLGIPPFGQAVGQVLHEGPTFAEIVGDGGPEVLYALKLGFNLLDLFRIQGSEVLFALEELLTSHVMKQKIPWLMTLGAQTRWNYVMIFHAQEKIYKVGRH